MHKNFLSVKVIRHISIVFLIFFLPVRSSAQLGLRGYSISFNLSSSEKLDTTIVKDKLDKLHELNQYVAKSVIDEFLVLPIDRCRQNLILISFSIDTLNQAEKINLKIGTGIAKIDSSLIAIVKKNDGRWKGVEFQNRKLKFEVRLEAKFNDFSKEIAREIDHPTEFYATMIRNGQANISKACEDDFYFYEKGIEEFKKGNFKYAAQDFNLALKANPYDLDALYNLSVSYFKLEKPEKACKCLKEASDYGDSRSIIDYKQRCNQQ